MAPWTAHLSTYLHTLQKMFVVYSPRLVAGFVVFVIVWIIAMITKGIIIRLAARANGNAYLYKMMGQVAKLTIVLIGLIMGLGTAGINVSALVASFGLAGFALSFALKDTLSNALAGFMILFNEPFKAGNYISVNSVEGEVIDINLRYTVVKIDSQHTLVPNSVVLNNPVTVKNQAPTPSS